MNRTWTILLSGLFGLPVVAVMAFVVFQPVKVLPRMQLAPGFALTDQDGQALTSEDLRGNITLYSFTYSHCPADCPPATARLRELQQQLGQRPSGGVPVKLVTVTVDAERDTPSVLRDFGAQLGADFDGWAFATGDETRLRRVVANGFGLFFARRPDGSFELDQRMYLVDSLGLIRAEYSFFVPTLERLLRDIRLLTEEAVNSQGMARYVYEAAHLFACYAP